MFSLRSKIESKLTKERNQNIFALAIIALFILLSGTSIVGKSITYDEHAHLLYGLNILNLNSDRFDNSKMPISALNAIPEKIGYSLPDGLLRNIFIRMNIARLVTVFISALFAFLIFYWSRKLFGFIPGVLSLTLYVFDPNIIAHSQLITTDIYCAGTIALSFYFLWKFAKKRNLINGIYCGLALGLSLIAKYTSVVLLPIFVLCLFIYDFFVRKNLTLGSEKRTLIKTAYKIGLYGLVLVVIPILVVNIGFLFNRTFTKFGDYKFQSYLFTGLQSHLYIMNNIPIPLPYPYLEGLDSVIKDESIGTPYVYLLGKLNDKSGIPGYYFLATLFKMPIATQIIIFCSFVVFITDKKRYRNFIQNELFLFVPLLFYVVYFNFFYRTQIGIRYYLVVYLFLYIFAGTLLLNWKLLSKIRKSIVLLLITYLVVSNLTYYPFYLSYFNEIVWDRTTSYKYLADSNLDWGQNQYDLDKYMKNHPGSIYAPIKPQAGHIIISANSLVGVRDGKDTYVWLRNNFKPDGNLSYSYLIFDITPEQLSVLCNLTDYCK